MKHTKEDRQKLVAETKNIFSKAEKLLKDALDETKNPKAVLAEARNWHRELDKNTKDSHEAGIVTDSDLLLFVGFMATVDSVLDRKEKKVTETPAALLNPVQGWMFESILTAAKRIAERKELEVNSND